MEYGFDQPLIIAYDSEESERQNDKIWRVISGFRYYYPHQGSLGVFEVPEGFYTDGASVPRWLWSLVPPWGSYGQAAVLHDFMLVTRSIYINEKYEPIPMSLINRIFYRSMKQLGEPRIVRYPMYVAVRCHLEIIKPARQAYQRFVNYLFAREGSC